MSEGVLRNVFDSMLKSPNESKSRHFIQQIPVKEKPSLKKKRTKKKQENRRWLKMTKSQSRILLNKS